LVEIKPVSVGNYYGLRGGAKLLQCLIPLSYETNNSKKPHEDLSISLQGRPFVLQV